MDDEIWKLAKECFGGGDYPLITKERAEEFYRAAFNAGIKAAATSVLTSDDKLMRDFHLERIRAPEYKP